ncbi:Mor transcription activator family protein [Vallitalea guaymasensis]|uniref:Mor transcription activator family protein n=1 Tax=Vallitalea guaymasensis TaxID=1185412 RepID=UPI000DE40C20|nr:Mor transcription activator family protein [Vallitalea guaymasensis]
MKIYKDWKNEVKEENLTGIYEEICERVGLDATLEIIDLLQGSMVYFPTLRKSVRHKVHEEIKKEFDGYNFVELAKKYGYTDRRIRQICEGDVKKKRNKPMENQMSLFDYV